MGDGTGIEWTDATWNPIRGCSRVSEGCRNCYAESVANRFSGPGMPYEGLAANGKWTGAVRVVEKALSLPLQWTRPRRIFVNSMSDLFHEALAFSDILRIFEVMENAKRHTFQVLTKRPKRAFDFCANYGIGTANKWPANVWLGVSVENQAAADERIPLLLETPAAVRFLSCEPLLGAVELDPLRCSCGNTEPDTSGDMPWCTECDIEMGCAGWLDDLDWVIAGGESGPGARPMHPAWARSLRDQCAAVGVPYFFKQWGEWAPRSRCEHVLAPGQAASEIDPQSEKWPCVRLTIGGNNGRELAHADDGGDTYMQRVGKKLAGSLLDGVEHKAFPVGAA